MQHCVCQTLSLSSAFSLVSIDKHDTNHSIVNFNCQGRCYGFVMWANTFSSPSYPCTLSRTDQTMPFICKVNKRGSIFPIEIFIKCLTLWKPGYNIFVPEIGLKPAVVCCLTNAIAPLLIALESCSGAQTDQQVF